jgi:hypothetical protein
VTDIRRHSLVLASDYRVPDPTKVWPLLQRSESALAAIGAHHVLVYASTWDYGRVLVTIGIRNSEPIVDLLRSRVFLDWFDSVGVTDIPAVFAGAIIERFELTEPPGPAPPGVIVAAVTAVRDVPTLITRVRGALDAFRTAGIRKVWIYRAFDDDQEVLILQEIDDEDSARRWIAQPDSTAEWMRDTGIDAYPPLFVGRLLHVMRIEAID